MGEVKGNLGKDGLRLLLFSFPRDLHSDLVLRKAHEVRGRTPFLLTIRLIVCITGGSIDTQLGGGLGGVAILSLNQRAARDIERTSQEIGRYVIES